MVINLGILFCLCDESETNILPCFLLVCSHFGSDICIRLQMSVSPPAYNQVAVMRVHTIAIFALTLEMKGPK